jgi:hypothetical protein
MLHYYSLKILIFPVSVLDGRLFVLHPREWPFTHEGIAPSWLPSVAVGCSCADWLRGQSPEYYGRFYEEHGLQRYEVYIDITSHPMFPERSPWSTWANGADMDDAMEKAAHMALIALCS